MSPCPSRLFFKGRSVEVMSLSFKKWGQNGDKIILSLMSLGTKWGHKLCPSGKKGQNGDIGVMSLLFKIGDIRT